MVYGSTLILIVIVSASTALLNVCCKAAYDIIFGLLPEQELESNRFPPLPHSSY